MSDLIRRSDAIKALRLEYPMMPLFKSLREEWAIKTEGYRKAEEVIMDIPTIEPKRGEWIEADVIDIEDTCIEEIQTLKCSICGRIQTKPYLYYVDCDNFCPNCGARMVGERENE